MKRLKSFDSFINEKAIMPSDFKGMLDEMRDLVTFRPLTIEQVNPITVPYGVHFVSYDTFYNDLPEHLKSTAPPRGTPIFGHIDANNRIKIVVSIPFIGIRELPFLNHMIQHESVHVGQWGRRAGNVEWTLPDAKDRKSYFSNKDEIMAFSQSVVEMMITTQNIRSLNDVQSALNTNRLWSDIKKHVDPEVQNRYLKYIYEYAKNYLEPESEVDLGFKQIMSSRNQGLSEGLSYHLDREIPLSESVYRIGSESWISIIKEARSLWESGDIELDPDDLFLISTDAGERGIYEGSDVLLEIPFENEEVDEDEYKGKSVDLNKPFRTPGGPRKFSVYVKDDKGKVVKVNFGQPGMRVNNADPEKARSFRKRMVCEKPGPKWKAKYWACNVGRYAKLLGLSSSRPW
jgi:hypothetical protein